MFIRRESFQQFIRLYPIVSWIVGINTVLFLLSFLFPALYAPIFRWGVGWNAAVDAGQYWRLVTPVFLHGGFGHFVFNSFSLIIFGPALERFLGRFKFAGFYLFAGIIGNLGTYLFEHPHYTHLGASGAIYGLLGVYLYMKFFRKDLIDPASAQIVTTILVVGAIYTFVMPNINILAHLFGFIAGAVAGPTLFKGRVKYFSMVNTPSYRAEETEEAEVGFDPNRWQKTRKRKVVVRYVVIGVIIALVLIGLLSEFL